MVQDMCKHVLNSTTYFQAPCCGIWVECTECHDERQPDHKMKFRPFVRLTCKVCRKRFDRNLELFSEKDKVCNFCGTAWNRPGVTPELKAFQEANAIIDLLMDATLESKGYYFNSIFSGEAPAATEAPKK